MPFDYRKKEVTIYSFWGTLMCLRLAKCCFCNGSKIEKDFEKMKWHVKCMKKCHLIKEKKK